MGMSSIEEVRLLDAPETTVLLHSGVANISKKIIAVMRDVGYVQKAGHNDFQNYKYATEADAIAALRPAMIKHGLCMIPSVESVEQDEWGNTNVLMHYRILDEDGNFLSFRAAGSGNDKNSKGVGDKGIYKALTGASKYALLKTFMMETGDDPEVPSQQEKESKPEPKPEVKPKAEIVDESDLSDAREAFVMMIKECAETCTTQEELQELWVGNKGELDKTKKVNPTVHEDIKQFFKAKKEAILKGE
jgi:hypothetical protein